MLPATLQFLIVMIASAINDRLQRKLDYVEEERRVLQEQLGATTGSKKLSFTANQRRRIAEAGKLLTPDERQKCCLIVKPAPEREKTRTWKQLMKAHWDSLCACDFFSVEALGIAGTVRYLVFFVMAVKTRAVEVAGIRADPDGEWMKQMARNLTDSVDGSLRNATYLIHARDPLFTAAFRGILQDRGVTCVRIPAQSPNCNAYAERFVKTAREECLRHFVFFGERHLRYVIREFMAHYYRERFHQALGGQLLQKSGEEARRSGKVVCRSRLGGMLNFYHREAA